jgi:DNA-directed RNA polymerase specialized sigma24 family protein
MKGRFNNSIPYITSAGSIKDTQRRRSLLRAVTDTWPWFETWLGAELPDTVDGDIFMDEVAGKIGAFETGEPVQNYRAYLLKSLVHEAKKLLQRAGRFENLDPAELALHGAASDVSVPGTLEKKILTKEALAILDDQTREICVLWSQGFKPKEIAAIVGMGEWAVRKRLARGIEQMRQFIQQAPKSEAGPTH